MTRTFTGRHIAAILVAGFSVIIAVNLWMAHLATSTFGGVTVENSYVASQKFNGWLNRAAAQQRLGWTAKVARDDAARLVVETTKVPQGASVVAIARHPLGRLPDRVLSLTASGDGRYTSQDQLPSGRWIVRLEISVGDTRWRSESDLR